MALGNEWGGIRSISVTKGEKEGCDERMAQRTVALCNGKYIGIESIYTVVNGRQINIPERLKYLRTKSRSNELFCPCGCGSNLVLVAGDRNLREQHFRIKDGSFNQNCKVTTEGKNSVNSKIVLKCWLDDKLKSKDIESRVPIHAVDDINRKYEFSFLSRSKKIAISYCYGRANLSDEKLNILKDNSQGIQIIYVVDSMNGGSVGQYPEGLMKIQEKQGYCLLMKADEAYYSKAELEAVFYAQDIDGLWQEVSLAKGLLKDFYINDDGEILYINELLTSKLSKKKSEFLSCIEHEKSRRIEALKEKHRLEEEKRQIEKRKREEDFKRNMESNFSQQEKPVRDGDGNRWIKCEFCGKIAMEDDFDSRGGIGHINLGTCKECFANNPAVKQKNEEIIKKARGKVKYNPNICPECGGKLCERNGPYGKFMGCSNYPIYRYSRKIR